MVRPLRPVNTLVSPGGWSGTVLGLGFASAVCSGLIALGATRVPAQDLVGCQLVDGGLQCVPGLTASPQQQIEILQQEISRTEQVEGAVRQRILGLDSLLLQGQAVEGGLLAATAAADVLASVPATAFHWYRLSPGQSRWQLISGATGPTHALTAADVGQTIMVVIALPQGDGSIQRIASPATTVVLSRERLSN